MPIFAPKVLFSLRAVNTAVASAEFKYFASVVTVFVATAQLNLSMTMVTTIIQGAVTAFKELQNVPI